MNKSMSKTIENPRPLSRQVLSLKGLAKSNRVKEGTNAVFFILFLLLAIVCLVPVILVFMISITSEESIALNGYQFFPSAFSADAYEFLWDSRTMIGRALGVSALVTSVGTALGIILTTTMGYVLSRGTYRLKGFLTWIVFIPMVFNGGLISTYNIYSSVLNLKDTIWVLILPLAVSSFNVIICKTFFKATIPDSIVESAVIDGASQFRIFFSIVLPISLPVIATIGLFLSFGYWNDWYLSLLYISDTRMYSLQAFLMAIENNIVFMAQNAATMGVTQASLAASMPKESMRMAISMVVVLPIACAYPFFQRYFISGLTIGAIKG